VIAPGTGHSLQEGPENGQDLPDLAVAQSIFGAIASTGNDAVQPGDTGTSLDQTQTDPVAACSTHTTVTATPTNPDHAGPAGASVGQTQTSLIPAQPPQSPMLTTGNNPIQARQTGTSLFRIFPSGSPRRPNIRLLLVSANPKDWPQLDVAREISVIKAVLDNSSTGDTFEIQNLEDCGPQQFIDAVDSFDPHIIQFAGHGTRHSLVFVNERQRGVKLSKGKLAQLVTKARQKSLRGLVLNACFSANDAPRFANIGVEVVAMQKSVGDDAAIVFSSIFYDRLRDGSSFGKAFSQAVHVVKALAVNDFHPELFNTRQAASCTRLGRMRDD
jgi:hypothetical protein